MDLDLCRGTNDCLKMLGIGVGVLIAGFVLIAIVEGITRKPTNETMSTQRDGPTPPEREMKQFKILRDG